jgi:hypothetical protein
VTNRLLHSRREFIGLLSGAAAGWPLAARAEQSSIPIIGFLSTNQSAAVPHFTAAFREGLAEAGFIDGKNVAIEFRFAEQRLERVPALAMDLVLARVIAMMANPSNPNAEPDFAEARLAARALGQEIHMLSAGTEQEVEAAFTNLAQSSVDALVFAPDPLFTNLRRKIVTLVEGRALPAIYNSRDYPDAGGLISYGASRSVPPGRHLRRADS